jgi:iron-sulfur cluster repair protein YtfE (RIC family)
MKRHAALQPLSRQHHQGLLVVLLLKKGLAKKADPVVMNQFILAAWQQELNMHFEKEEQVLLPSSTGFIDQYLLDKLLLDHASIRQTIQRLATGKVSSDLITNFAQNLETHIRWEEKVLFPSIENILPANILNTLELEDVDQYNCIHFPVKFWE